ncbi:ABC transporter substrate-binding protein [Clostridium formicaceticum]|uniref:ABC transporter substrate-binding protein n=1 Tax=Clostridium formicaceticum TaxID=1497 RepID=A0AAC9RJ80_9CLOT|nr:ABC transporter substrate-binding protein [Clostridium formicaceticum]AOY77516.1 ABC transporter substrate-binding protein [Clostridium formicaceticum]ARE88084.1 sn-glycerol-3-phosphate-binding periplasmic protein UgpB precursor [Clostridium formicaceticum]
MKKRVLIAVILVLSMLLSACGGSSENQEKPTAEVVKNEYGIATEITEPVVIEFWNSMTGVDGKILEEITDRFNEEHDMIEVKLVYQGGYRDLFEKLMASARAGQLPALSQIYSNRLSWYVNQGLVEALDPYMNHPEIGYTEEEVMDIIEAFRDDGVWNDTYYALPFNKSSQRLYYIQDMFDEAGIDVPTTWEELEKAAAILTKDLDGNGQKDIYGLVLQNDIATDIAPWVWQAGGKHMSDDEDTIFFESEATIEAISFINGLIQQDIARLAGEDGGSNIPFEQGRAAMAIASTSRIPSIRANITPGTNWGIAPLPAHKEDVQLYFGTNVTMFNTSEPEEKLAAFIYLKYLINTENAIYWAMNTGYLPIRYSVLEMEEFKAYGKENPIDVAGLEGIENGRQGERLIGAMSALDVLGEELEQLIHNRKTIDEALADAQRRGLQAIEQARRN